MQPLLETTKSSTVIESAREVLDSVPPVMWFIRRQMRAHRGALSLAQFRSLARVNRQPNASLSVVAEHLGASLPTTSRIVAGLVDKGLLIRHGCVWDRRQVSLELTPKGREVLQTARRAAQQVMELELARLSAPHRSALIKGLQVLKSVFGPANHDGAKPTKSRGGKSSKPVASKNGAMA
jgi:DNA-binding MarR family transcriptional regulator